MEEVSVAIALLKVVIAYLLSLDVKVSLAQEKETL
jgi:hypothetical protein